MVPGSSGAPTLVHNGNSIPLTRLSLTASDTAEDWLQHLLDNRPDILPIDEISSSWGPLISLGREIAIPAGLVDNLFVSPAGELTVVEAKLWRNPEARRKVIGQILDYAAALAAMSFEDLDEAVRNGPDSRPIWQRVIDSTHRPLPNTEPAFVDTLTRNLRKGRFLLLVVGDGIRSDLQSIASLLGEHPTLGFHLELVELRIYSMPYGDLLVVPSLVGRSEEVSRAVVEIKTPENVQLSVTVAVPEPTPQRRTRIASFQEFLDRASEKVGSPAAEAIAQLAEWWRTECGGLVKLNSASISLHAPYPRTAGISVLTIYTDGMTVGSVATLAETRSLLAPDEVLARYQAAGFGGGDPRWPSFQFDPTVEDERLRVMELLTWAADLIRASAAALRS